jgi:hypothetical protein
MRWKFFKKVQRNWRSRVQLQQMAESFRKWTVTPLRQQKTSPWLLGLVGHKGCQMVYFNVPFNIPTWVNLRGPLNGKGWYILGSFGIYWAYFVHFIAIWKFSGSLVYFPPFWYTIVSRKIWQPYWTRVQSVWNIPLYSSQPWAPSWINVMSQNFVIFTQNTAIWCQKLTNSLVLKEKCNLFCQKLGEIA